MKNRKRRWENLRDFSRGEEISRFLTLKINRLNYLWDHFNERKSEAFVEKWEGELKTSKIF